MKTDLIIKGDCLDVTPLIDTGAVDLVFADPPFNIGLEYDAYEDNRPYEEYVDWTNLWIKECHRLLKPNGSIYVSIGDEFAPEIALALRRAGFYFRNHLIWHFTFGQNTRSKFARCHTHILYCTKHKTDFIFNKKDVLIPSARQLVYGDKRAASAGKVPDDVWPVYVAEPPHDKCLRVWPDEYEIWDDSRVCGTFSERIGKHPCQMPLSVLSRIILASSNKDELVFDPFVGTGTTMVAARNLGRHYLGTEISQLYYEVATKRLELT